MLTETKRVKVAEVWDNTRGDGAWSPSFSRPFNDREVVEVQTFLNLLNSRRTFQLEKDRLFWRGIQMIAIQCRLMSLSWKEIQTEKLLRNCYGIV